MARHFYGKRQNTSSTSKSATAANNVQPPEFSETATAQSPSQVKATLTLPILLGSPYRSNLPSSFSHISHLSASEPPSQFSAQHNLKTAATSSDSQNPDLQPINKDSFCPKDVRKASDDSDDPDDLSDADDSDNSDHIQGQDVLPFNAEAEAPESTPTEVGSHVTQVWEAARAENESFREYANRRAKSFGYDSLREGQLDALEELVQNKRDVMLIAKTSFGKSLIFQLAPLLMPDPEQPGISLILMPLTLLQRNQSETVRKKAQHLGAKCIVLDGDTNTAETRKQIAEEKYTHGTSIPVLLARCSKCQGGAMQPRTPASCAKHHTYILIVFSSPEIVNEDLFRNEILRKPRFRERLCCVAIDEAHLVVEWKHFRHEYSRIGWFRKFLPRHVPLFAASATLSPRVRDKVKKSCSFRGDHRLLTTSIDRPEIFVGVHKMKHPMKSFLDLSGILPKEVATGGEIPKTVIFVDSIRDIQAMRHTMLNWMRKLKYPPVCKKWVKSYFSSMAQADKDVIAADFGTANQANNNLVRPLCRILIATTAYGLGIDNPDVKQVILWGVPRSVEDALQRLGRAMRNGLSQAVGLIFVPKWCIGPRTAAGKPQHSLSQAVSVNDSDNDFSDADSVLNADDAYIVDVDTGVKKRLTHQARRDLLDQDLYFLVNPGNDCIRERMLQAMGDDTYLSEAKPSPCCSVCQPDLFRPEINPDLISVPIKRNNVHLFFIEAELRVWREKQIRSQPIRFFDEYPAAFMPDEVLKSLTLHWSQIKEVPGPESLAIIKEICHCWAEGEQYEEAIYNFFWRELQTTWSTMKSYGQYDGRKWSIKPLITVERQSAASLEREEKRKEARSLLAPDCQLKLKEKANSKKTTRVEKLGGKAPLTQPTLNENRDRAKGVDKVEPADRARTTGGRFTSGPTKRSASTLALSSRKVDLKRSKSPASTTPMGLTAAKSSTTLRSPLVTPSTRSAKASPSSPNRLRKASRVGRVYKESKKHDEI